MPASHVSLKDFDVDVIILSLDRASETIAAIESTLAQQGVQKNVIVVDQGSSAPELARITAYVAGKPVRFEALAENRGVPGGRNYAAGLGRAPIIVAIDNDARFEGPDVLRRTVVRMRTEPDLGALGFRILDGDTDEDDWGSWVYPFERRADAGKEFEVASFVGAGHALRREAFERAGGYDDLLFFMWEELDLSHRILDLGYRMVYAPDLVVRHTRADGARLHWHGARFYYNARNRMYLHAKYGGGFLRAAKSAVGFLMQGALNGFLPQAIQAVVDTPGLLRRHRARSAREQARCDLKAETRARIAALDGFGGTSIATRLRRDLFRKVEG